MHTTERGVDPETFWLTKDVLLDGDASSLGYGAAAQCGATAALHAVGARQSAPLVRLQVLAQQLEGEAASGATATDLLSPRASPLAPPSAHGAAPSRRSTQELVERGLGTPQGSGGGAASGGAAAAMGFAARFPEFM